MGGKSQYTWKDTTTWVPQIHPSPAEGKKTKPTPHSCSTRASSTHFSLLKIFLNKELSASGRPKPSPTGSQMPGSKEAVSSWHDTPIVGERVLGAVRGWPCHLRPAGVMGSGCWSYQSGQTSGPGPGAGGTPTPLPGVAEMRGQAVVLLGRLV